MKKLVVVAALGLATQAFAGPFGLSQGMPIEEANKLGQFVPEGREYTYVAKKIANGHADFESYSILLTPQQGLCSVVAVSKDMQSNAYGHQLKRKFHELTSTLSQKYSYPQVSLDISRTFDFSKNFGFWNLDGMWIQDSTWMDRLLDQTKTLNATWDATNPMNVGDESIGKPSLMLPDSLEWIRLNAAARSASRGYMRLEYRFSNYSVCIKEAHLKRNANL